MTDPFLSACKAWTGDRPDTCMWRALEDEFVGRVLRMHRFFETGNLAVYAPDPSHREVEGLAYYVQQIARIEANAAAERHANEQAAAGAR